MSSTQREAWKPTCGSSTELCEFSSARPAQSSKASVRASPNAACPVPNAKRSTRSPTTSIATAPRMRYHEYLANGWPIASGPVEGACKNLIKLKIAWNAPACAGPSQWRRPLYNSEPSISQEILIATGNSTSIRTSVPYIPSPGPSFQSSHTQIISKSTGSICPPCQSTATTCDLQGLVEEIFLPGIGLSRRVDLVPGSRT